MKIDRNVSFPKISSVAIANEKIYISTGKTIEILDLEGSSLKSIAVLDETPLCISVYNEAIFYKSEKKIFRIIPGESPVIIYESYNIRSRSNFAIHKNGSIFVTMRNANTLLRIRIRRDGYVIIDILGPCLVAKPFFLWFNSTGTKLVTADNIGQFAIYECMY